MERGCTENNENVYFQARKHAAETNDTLNSREGAVELLGLSSSTLAKYELDMVKQVPVDSVVMMAELYNCPELKTRYCKCECPIGERMPLATQAKNIERAVIRLCNNFDIKEIKGIKKEFMEIAEDGKVDEEEMNRMTELLSQLDRLSLAINELKLTCLKAIGGNE